MYAVLVENVIVGVGGQMKEIERQECPTNNPLIKQKTQTKLNLGKSTTSRDTAERQHGEQAGSKMSGKEPS